MVARDFLAQRERDPGYQAMRAAKDRELAERAEQRQQEQKPLLDDLAAIGVVVDSISHLCRMPRTSEQVFAVLLHHLQRPYSPHMLEWIGRAFGTRSARPFVWNDLVALLKTHALEEAAADGVMTAISEIAQPRDLETLIDLITDRSLGSRRIFLVQNLMRSRRPEARAILLRLQDDTDLAGEITTRLRRSRR
jgi:hypothetical protein